MGSLTLTRMSTSSQTLSASSNDKRSRADVGPVREPGAFARPFFDQYSVARRHQFLGTRRRQRHPQFGRLYFLYDAYPHRGKPPASAAEAYRGSVCGLHNSTGTGFCGTRGSVAQGVLWHKGFCGTRPVAQGAPWRKRSVAQGVLVTQHGRRFCARGLFAPVPGAPGVRVAR